MERPIITITIITIASFGGLFYLVLSHSPEEPLSIYFFVLLLQTFLTGGGTIIGFLIKKTLASRLESGKVNFRKTLSYTFTIALFPSVYYLLKNLGAANLLNLILLSATLFSLLLMQKSRRR